MARLGDCAGPLKHGLRQWVLGMRPTAAAVASNRSRVQPGAIWPCRQLPEPPTVSVPVLSKITAAARFLLDRSALSEEDAVACAQAGADHDRHRVARPGVGAGDHETVMVRGEGKEQRPPGSAEPERKGREANDDRGGTSHCEARSASSCAGALEFCAVWTSLMICASAVSLPILVAV